MYSLRFRAALRPTGPFRGPCVKFTNSWKFAKNGRTYTFSETRGNKPPSTGTCWFAIANNGTLLRAQFEQSYVSQLKSVGLFVLIVILSCCVFCACGYGGVDAILKWVRDEEWKELRRSEVQELAVIQTRDQLQQELTDLHKEQQSDEVDRVQLHVENTDPHGA